MVTSDIFVQNTIIFRLDKPYILHFSLRVAYELERRHGTVDAVLRALYGDSVEASVNAAIDFLHALLSIDKNIIESEMSAKHYSDFLCVAIELVMRDFPEKNEEQAKNENTLAKPNDWDSLYYTARYLLNMSDDEFWQCTPRRFWKLDYLRGLHHGYAQPKDEMFMGEMDY